jgi:ATP-binding cassette, subfamily G (WHITE), member 2, SNQ2
MYHVSPYTYVVEGLLGQALGKQEIICGSVELVTIQPPSGQTCQSYMETYISTAGGYLTNADASSDCSFCPISSTDQFLSGNFNIEYSHRWRNVGIICAFIVFNVSRPNFLTFATMLTFRL